MTEQINGQLGDWASKCADAKPIDVKTKSACLAMFSKARDTTGRQAFLDSGPIP